MNRIHRTLAAAALLAAAACSGSKGGAQDEGYANDADTGAAAPATVLTPSGPADSTNAQSTGQPGVAGVPQAQGSDISAPTGKSPDTTKRR